MKLTISEESPRSADIVQLLETHLAFAETVTPAGHVHALDLEALDAAEMSFFAAREDDMLLGIGALRRLDADRAEIKSMHTTERARGRGIGRMVLDHLMATAVQEGITWLGLETGTYDAFAPARNLYATAGFEPCPPFSDYSDNPFSVCMSRRIDD